MAKDRKVKLNSSRRAFWYESGGGRALQICEEIQFCSPTYVVLHLKEATKLRDWLNKTLPEQTPKASEKDG